MNIYKAFYQGKTFEIQAETSLQAQHLATERFGAKKSWEVTVVLCEKDGETVQHQGGEL